MLTYKMIGASHFNYACPIYSPNLKKSHFDKMQTAQNQCLCVITGSHGASSMQHLHGTSRRGSCPSPPSHDVSMAPQAPRLLCYTLTLKYSESVSPLTTGGVVPPGQCGDALKSLNTTAVESAIRKLDAKPNRVLGCCPPSIHASSKSFPRPWRSTLSQLRSGWCRCLKSYGALLDNNIDNNCPECNSEPHTPEHLFACPSRPTTLYRVDLWSNPLHAAAFLSSVFFSSSFCRLPFFST